MVEQRRSRPGALIGLAGLCLLLAGACSSDQGPPAPAPDGGGAAGPGGARVEEFNLDEVIVEQTVALPSSPEDEVTLGVLSLRVAGDVMVLRLAVTPRLTSVGDDETVTLFAVLEGSGFAPTLIDMANLKQYSVISDTGRMWAGSSANTRSRNGQPMLAWAVFAAPEDDIDTINVRITEWWPEFLDVPIER